MAAVTKILPASKRVEPPQSESSTLREVLGLMVVALALAMLLSLISFHPADASWSVAGSRGGVHNWIGRIGAVVADLVFQTFGLVAFFLPVVIGFLAWKLFHEGGTLPSLSQFGGVVLGMLACTGLLSLVPQFPMFRERIRPGGFVGYLIATFLETSLNKVGTALLLGMAIVMALML